MRHIQKDKARTHDEVMVGRTCTSDEREATGHRSSPSLRVGVLDRLFNSAALRVIESIAVPGTPAPFGFIFPPSTPPLLDSTPYQTSVRALPISIFQIIQAFWKFTVVPGFPEGLWLGRRFEGIPVGQFMGEAISADVLFLSLGRSVGTVPNGRDFPELGYGTVATRRFSHWPAALAIVTNKSLATAFLSRAKPHIHAGPMSVAAHLTPRSKRSSV